MEFRVVFDFSPRLVNNYPVVSADYCGKFTVVSAFNISGLVGGVQRQKFFLYQ